MKKLEKWIWRTVLYSALGFCTVVFAAAMAGPYPNTRLTFFVLCAALLFAIDKLE